MRYVADAALALLRARSDGGQAALIGQVGEARSAPEVWVRTAFGQERPLDWPNGELLPRIC